MNRRELLLRQLSAVQFAVWELHVYLDTHPCDEKALSFLEKNMERYEALKCEYEASYGPLDPKSGSAAAWLADPWPWEREGDDC